MSAPMKIEEAWRDAAEDAYATALVEKRYVDLTAIVSAVAPLIRAKALEEAWQPIETAPKDGTIFLAYEPDGDPNVVACAWYRFEDTWWVGYADTVLADITGEAANVTHWRPYPSPPALASNGQKS